MLYRQSAVPKIHPKVPATRQSYLKIKIEKKWVFTFLLANYAENEPPKKVKIKQLCPFPPFGATQVFVNTTQY
jgi:hypothetical protein